MGWAEGGTGGLHASRKPDPFRKKIAALQSSINGRGLQPTEKNFLKELAGTLKLIEAKGFYSYLTLALPSG